MLNAQLVQYRDEETILEAYCAHYGKTTDVKPAVLIVHDWSGRNEFAQQKAVQIAELGYVGIAIDMYGKGKIGKTIEEKQALMNPLVQDRNKLLKRIQAAYETAKKLPQVDSERMSGMGFCFGGLCILDLARSGAHLQSVISIHGILAAPNTKKPAIHAKILALHGFNDPMVTPADVLKFEEEMTAAKADWQMHIFGSTKHAFTNPEAHDEKLGTVYNPLADKRSWIAIKNFLSETL